MADRISAGAETAPAPDPVVLGRRLRHLRKQSGRTLDQLAAAVEATPSHLSLIENGKREPRISLLTRLASALGTTLEDLLSAEAPSRRAALEIAVEKAQRGAHYATLGLPQIKITPRTPTEVLEVIAGLEGELRRRLEEQAATPEEARRANAELRQEMKERDNHYPELERRAQELLDAVGHSGGPLSHRAAAGLAEHLGFSVRFVSDLPHSTRSVTDLKNRRFYLARSQHPDHDARSVLLGAIGSYVLGHGEPTDYSDFLRQRIYTNYFAAALMMPQKETVKFLKSAKAERDLAIEDIRDAFGVSYESAAHRFTNLATEHLGITCHFQKVHESGIIHKAYENDGVSFPADHTGAIEGQQVCRYWTSREVFDVGDGFRAFNQYTDTPAGTFWCTAVVEGHSSGFYSLSIGVPFDSARWFRGKETTSRSISRCPDPSCCRQPNAELEAAWGGHAWPAARANAHLLAAMPSGAFPGVDEVEVFEFLQAQDQADLQGDLPG
ncbi:helix-turn-helix domain-containing protein [Micrococcus terreus]|uniref:helix-turn-helix domain-containing protein n=1 Tax=Micrococcus terreus TaxID=574650 RepID=UPI00254F7506|nr:helix-turn-helix domain-containing protein [Micrococcus terreus]MDK7700681.1 helix-turn-helix domain-containing protein [Micrococcus terreus]WOO97381.1 helix-turn-helix domain-containing protein [Micrococcus terreus]